MGVDTTAEERIKGWTSTGLGTGCSEGKDDRVKSEEWS